MPTALAIVVDDLAAEEDELGRLLATLDAGDWTRPTPASGWTVLDQVAHLAEGEELAALALNDEVGFAEHLARLLADLDATLAAMEARARARSAAETLAVWDAARRATIQGLRARDTDDRVPWITGPMSSVSFASARLMETWAHGQDVLDALGRSREPSARLRHIAHLGFATRGFSFRNRGLAVPAASVLVTLSGPDGETWTFGEHGAPDRVTGSALDFCLVVTQRRHVDDTTLVAEGEGARRWLAIAQAFAGPPTDGRPPRN